MKRIEKKLKITRELLRTLTVGQLEAAAGGIETTTNNNTCASAGGSHCASIKNC